MQLSRIAAGLALGLALAPLTSAQGHDEAIDGDLSGTAGAPTVVAVSIGSNVVTGTVVAPADTRDFFTFTIPVGQQLEAVNLLALFDVPSGGDADLAYHAIDAGPVSVNPSMGTAGDFLGGDHLGSFSVGTDVFPNLAAASTNGSGFTIPLGPGRYTYIVQQTGPEHTGYSLEFIVGEPTWTDQGCELAGAGGDPELTGTGDLSAGSANTVSLTNAAASAQAGLFVGLTEGAANFKGGVLKPVPWTVFKLLNTNGAGEIIIPFIMPAGLPAGTELWIQYGIQDAGAPVGVALSNALRGVTP